MKPSFFDLTYDELKALLVQNGFSPFGATQMFDWVYKKWIHNPAGWSNVSQKARNFFLASKSCMEWSLERRYKKIPG